jgi:hypothetical protein
MIKFVIKLKLKYKHFRAILNKNIVQQVGIKYYICNIVAWKMNNIKYGYWFQETTDVRLVFLRIKLQ